MNSNFGRGQTYRLSQLAIRLRTFTARELVALTGMVEDTVYGFVARLIPQGYLEWDELPRSTRGRPVKRYTVTEKGLDYLLRENAHVASILNGEIPVVPPQPAAISAKINSRINSRLAAAFAEPTAAADSKESRKYAASSQDHEATAAAE